METRPDSMLPDDAQKLLRAWSLMAKVTVEIGSCPGRSAESILTWSKGVLFMVDDRHPFGQAKQRLRERLKTHFDDGRAFMLDMGSDEAFPLLRKLLAYRPADMVFMDSGCTATQLEMDIFNYSWLLQSGGRLCGRFEDKLDYVNVLERVLPGWKEESGLFYMVMP